MCTCTSYQSRGKFINSSYIIKLTRNEQPGNIHQVKDNENNNTNSGMHFTYFIHVEY